MSFGIRGKVALLVILATAISALLVSRGLSKRAQQVLREHELVDLGDEATLRGWWMIDRIDSLDEDLESMARDEAELQSSYLEGATGAELEAMAKSLCRREWDRYLYIDIVELDGRPMSKAVVQQSCDIDPESMWFPGVEAKASKGQHISTVQRLQVTRHASGDRLERTRWETVVWGVAPLNKVSAETGKPTYLRVLNTIYSEASPRHFMVIEDDEGELLFRHEEFELQGRNNSDVFLAFKEDPLVKAALERGLAAAEKQDQAKVDRLVISENVKLNTPYNFIEGIPGPDLVAAMDLDDVDDFEAFYDDFLYNNEPIGRAGGLHSGVRELRLLAQTPERLQELKDNATQALKDRYGVEFDYLKWRTPVECDEIHAWAVQVLVGRGDDPQRYLLHYAAMDDEMASSINHEMASLRRFAVLIAAGAGIIAFLIVLLFVRPLKRMTATASRITDSNPEDLRSNLQELIDQLAIRRRDEVGEISRASKRLFEEVIQSQDSLEQRVEDRTRELRRTNFELEEANRQLKSLSHEKDAFVAKVSHDLRQPLNAIFLQVEALKLTELDDLQKQDVEKIHQHATRELNLVNDILEYQKIIMGAERLNRDEIDVGSLIEDLSQNHSRFAQDKGLEFTVSADSTSGVLHADDKRVRQILGNLVHNAIKFTKEGSVRVSATKRVVLEEDWIEFEVADTGRGMAPEEQAKAFVPFVSNKKDNAAGTGLGLSICKELTERMGGRVGFVSELGKGTTFHLLIPREAKSKHYDEVEDSSLVAAVSGEVSSELPSEGSTVLVIDDDASVRELLTNLLQGEGYEVLTASSGEAGLQVAREKSPHAITLDVVMPGGIDGWEVLRQLKEDAATENIPVVMVSVMAAEAEGIAFDVEDYLVKPINLERLSRVVSRITQHSPQQNFLLVDDDHDAREALGRLIEDRGWKVSHASNGKEALAVLTKTRPAAIVLDLMMPEMDGFEFLRQLQREENLASIPVIVVSGKEPTEEERAFLRERVTTVLSKEPDAEKALLSALRHRLRR
ncbi:MAG: response regulator [Verrucomicrobiota bacterium]